MGLSPRAQKLLDAYRAQESIPTEQVDALLGDLSQRLARGEMPTLQGAPSSVKLSALQVLWGKLPILLPCAFGLGTMAAVWLWSASSPQPSSIEPNGSAPRLEAPAAVLAEPVPHVESLAPQAESVDTETDSLLNITQTTTPFQRSPSARRRDPSGARAARSTAMAPHADTEPVRQEPVGIEEELNLMRRAHELLRTKSFDEALRVVDTHAARFPNGKLADSRELTRVLSLCRSGREEQARTEVERFLKRFPESPFAGRVKVACLEK